MALRKGISEGMKSDGKMGSRIAELREQKGQTLMQLAQRVGVSDTCIWNWERGNTKPRHDSLTRLVAGLETTRAYLLRGELAPDVQEASNKEKQSLAELIRDARDNIAAAAGISVSQVKVTLHYGS